MILPFFDTNPFTDNTSEANSDRKQRGQKRFPKLMELAEVAGASYSADAVSVTDRVFSTILHDERATCHRALSENGRRVHRQIRHIPTNRFLTPVPAKRSVRTAILGTPTPKNKQTNGYMVFGSAAADSSARGI
jgi:hypothetical protein